MQHIASIAKIQLKLLQTRLAKMDLEVAGVEAALAELAKVGFDPVFGASAQAGHPAAHREPLVQAAAGRALPPKSVISWQ